MKRRILPFLLAAVLCFVAFCPSAVCAESPDSGADASLTLRYQKDGVGFADCSIGIYRVAELYSDGRFGLIEPYDSYPINIYGITLQEQWQYITQTVCSYIVADRIEADYEAVTDESGTVCFSDLQTGLYFVREVVAENENGIYVFNPFMVYVPTPLADGTYDYTVEAYPKCTEFIPNTHYTVTKLWRDGGKNESRPKEVTVDIYRDGVLQETQILCADNDWSYTWHVSGTDTAEWTVAEQEVPEGYTVSILKTDNVFSVINTAQASPEPPETGDTTVLWPWILILCVSGILLLLLGLYGRRRK